MNRREFLKRGGAGAAAFGTAMACSGRQGHTEEDSCRCSGRMPRRECGEDIVGLLGYGCMRWKMKKDADGNNVVDQDSVNELVDRALEAGVNYFDSAPVYLRGLSERASALALLRHPRETYFIATKCSNQKSGQEGYEAGIAMYRSSLAAYETDHIDYYLLHNVHDAKNLKDRFEDNGLLDYFLKERELGHIRNLGFSFHGDSKGFDELLEKHSEYHWDFVQIQMNYVDWTRNTKSPAKYLYERLEALGIPVVIMEPLLGGRLANVPDVIASEMKDREPQKSIASWAFRFCGTFPKVLTVLSGMTYMEHLEDNLSTYLDFKALSPDELDFLEKMAYIIRSYPLVDCTECNYCMPCPYGIDIPTIFRHYNSAVNSGSVAESTEQKRYRALKRRYLTGYDKAIESIRQADHCIGCGQCIPRCPQKIKIPEQLRRIDRYVEKLKQDKL